jgi:L-threonylcarbamoyladenylate synthase
LLDFVVARLGWGVKVVGIDAGCIGRAVGLLRQGMVVVAPTDSVYGLFGDALSESTVGRIRRIKGRDIVKPFQIAVLKEEAGRYGIFSDVALGLVERYWPGDVNFIVEKTALVPDFVGFAGTVCLTCHANVVADALVRGVGRPLVSTSVNLGGMSPAVRVGDIDGGVLDGVDLVLDGGEARNRVPNTIVDLTKNPAVVVREGRIGVGELAGYIKLSQ